MVMLVRALQLSLALALVVVGCKSPDDVVKGVNAIVLVTHVDDDEIAVIDVAGQLRRSNPPENDLIEIQLVLPPGTHDGTVVILRVRDDEDDEDDEDNEGDEGDEPRGCGSFTVAVDAGDITTVVIDGEELSRCGDEGEGEGEEGEGEEGEGEEGEGEDGEGEDEPDGEGEGEDEPEDGEGEGEDEPDGEGEGEGEGEDEPDGEGEGER